MAGKSAIRGGRGHLMANDMFFLIVLDYFL